MSDFLSADRPLRSVMHASLHALIAPSAPRLARGDKAPVLCFLHGFDEAAPMELFDALVRHGPLHPEASPFARGFVVVAPQLPLAGDRWHRHADGVRELVQLAIRDHGGDAARCFLTGFSYGGNGVFDLGLSQPDLWTALWSVDPTRPPDPRLEQPAWLTVGPIVRERFAAFVEAMGSVAADAAPDALRVHLDEDEDHVGAARRAYADARPYEWLLRRA